MASECEVSTYLNGKLQRSTREARGFLLVVESDLDGSYYLYRFPVGFGEGLPRLRKVGENLYEGEDTFRGITTVSKQSVTVKNETINIKHRVFDAPSNQLQSDTACTGSRLAARYRSVKPFSDGLAAVAGVPRGARTAKWGFIDETGRLVIPMRYDEVTSFGEGYAVPGRSGLRWNLINRENTTIFQGFDDIGCFVGGRAPATHTEGNSVRRGYVDKVGDFFADNR